MDPLAGFPSKNGQTNKGSRSNESPALSHRSCEEWMLPMPPRDNYSHDTAGVCKLEKELHDDDVAIFTDGSGIVGYSVAILRKEQERGGAGVAAEDFFSPRRTEKWVIRGCMGDNPQDRVSDGSRVEGQDSRAERFKGGSR